MNAADAGNGALDTDRMYTEWQNAISQWLVAMRAAGYPETTLTTRRSHMRRCARAMPCGPWQTGSDDLVEWMASQAWGREMRRGAMSTMRSFWAWAIRTGRCEANPAAELPRVPPAHPAPHPLPEDALRAALGGVDARVGLMIRLAAEAGLRRGEISRVHGADLSEDLGGPTLRVHGKGAKVRTLPITRSLARAIRIAARDGYAFPGEVDGHISADWTGKLISRELPGAFTTHSLRHRFAAAAWSIDHDLATVQDLLGHASPATTRIYVAGDTAVARRLIEAVAA